MKTFSDFWSVPRDAFAGSVLVLGTFDGVHLGHQALLNAAVHWARPRGKKVLVVTFVPSPASVLFSDRATPPLVGLECRLGLFADLGIDAAIVQRFDLEFAQIPPEEFVHSHLFGAFEPTAIFVGQNFTFGKGGHGTSELLRGLCLKRGIKFTSAPLAHVGGVTISSSEIRRRLLAGDVEGASSMLGRRFSLEGEVIHGRARGRHLGFPTANLRTDGLFLPKDGVYGALCVVKNDANQSHEIQPNLPAIQTFGAVLNLGKKPTFSEVDVTLEAFLLGAPADLDLYGKRLELILGRRLRDEQKFSDAQALSAQIQRDCVEALEAIEALKLARKTQSPKPF